MGGKDRVQVEQLVSRCSIEELIVQMNREKDTDVTDDILSRYWSDSAKALGIVDTSDVLCFVHNPGRH